MRGDGGLQTGVARVAQRDRPGRAAGQAQGELEPTRARELRRLPHDSAPARPWLPDLEGRGESRRLRRWFLRSRHCPPRRLIVRTRSAAARLCWRARPAAGGERGDARRARILTSSEVAYSRGRAEPIRGAHAEAVAGAAGAARRSASVSGVAVSHGVKGLPVDRDVDGVVAQPDARRRDAGVQADAYSWIVRETSRGLRSRPSALSRPRRTWPRPPMRRSPRSVFAAARTAMRLTASPAARTVHDTVLISPGARVPSEWVAGPEASSTPGGRSREAVVSSPLRSGDGFASSANTWTGSPGPDGRGGKRDVRARARDVRRVSWRRAARAYGSPGRPSTMDAAFTL